MTSTIALPLLENVRIAAPCHVRWEDMTGDEVRRVCAECTLTVTNISAMTREQAEAFLQNTAAAQDRGERVCIGMYRRADGTILTSDCPVGLAKLKAGARAALLRIAAALGLATALGVGAATMSKREGFMFRNLYALRWLSIKLNPEPVPFLPGIPLLKPLMQRTPGPLPTDEGSQENTK